VRSRFSIGELFVATTAVAAGAAAVQISKGGIFEFCLGALTGLTVVGLGQQVIARRSPATGLVAADIVRRCAVLLILIALAASIYRVLHPFPYEEEPFVISLFTLGSATIPDNPLWFFCLVLGAITAPWMSASHVSSDRDHASWTRMSVSVLTLALLSIYFVNMLSDVTIIHALIDIAIDGVNVGRSQPAAAGSEHFVSWFGRTPAQFRTFVQNQLVAWPLLLLATLLCVWTSQRPKANWQRGVCWFGILALTTPAVFNLWWLLDGAAETLFPELVTGYREQRHPDLIMVPLGLLLVCLYFVARTTRGSNPEPSGKTVRYATDYAIVGVLFMMIGVQGVLDILDYTSITQWLSFEPVVAILEAVHYPHYSYQMFLLPFGAYWLWRRWQFTDTGTVDRWPQFHAHQAITAPMLLLLLTLLVLSSLPFGIATFHAFI